MTDSIKIIPAILTDDPQALKSMLNQIAGFTDYVQIDIMDSQFVPSHSISWEHLIENPPRVEWEAHLMVLDPASHFAGYQKAGACKVIFHYEATSSPADAVTVARQLGLKVGLAVNPETPVSSILPIVNLVDSILFLAVHPGFYGARFIPETLEKITSLRSAQPDIIIGIDGGIKETNIAEVARTGVNEICVGSAIFSQPDPAESYRRLLALANSG